MNENMVAIAEQAVIEELRRQGLGSRLKIEGLLELRPIVRAVMRAMREPTDAMIDAGDDICPVARGTETHRMSGGRVPEDYWRVMIDTALAEDPSA